jgi:hypothetical protein
VAELTAAQRQRLRRWERRLLAVYAALLLWLGAGTLLQVVGGLQGQTAWGVYAVGVALIALVTAFQFTGRCPHCGARLGLQTRLYLPSACKRCGGPLR